jgi:phosphopantetheinyl transferase (holo-ACP synthase)
MIGNDVVDLVDADSRVAGHHPRFDERVFTPAERGLIAASPVGERVRWVLWAAKESAYKAARRMDARTVFSPPRFVVRLGPDGAATVAADGRAFDVDLAADDDRVHAIARARDCGEGMVYSAVARLGPGAAGDPPGAAVRRLTVTTLSRLLDIPEGDLALDRAARVPRLWLRGRPSTAAVSLSHHGRFVAFACRWPGAGAAA